MLPRAPLLALLGLLPWAPACHADAPRTVLWAWESPQDLRGVGPDVGVAFSARTVGFSGSGITTTLRHQPLRVRPDTWLAAVVRVEPARDADRPVDADADALVDAIAPAATLPGVRMLQVDWDAVVSERALYATVLTRLRARLPASLPLGITALASWCVGDRWIDPLPVDVVVPMLFRMGPDDAAVRQAWMRGDDLDPRCRAEVGVSTDEPRPDGAARARPWIFHPGPWTAADLDAAVVSTR
jgi:hypothetical protein